MKAAKLLLTLMLLVAVAACAALSVERPPEQNAELRLERGLLALDAGRHSEAFDDLAWVYSHCSGRQAGVRALTALAALELDPRNPRARPAVGTELLGRLIRHPGTPPWTRPLTETVFLSSLALGAPRPSEALEPGVTGEAADTTHPPLEDPDHEEDPDHDHDAPAVPPVAPVMQPATAAAAAVHGCGPAVAGDDPDRVAPALPELPGPSMVALLAGSEARRDTLQKELTAVKEQLAATRAELERIRKTLKP